MRLLLLCRATVLLSTGLWIWTSWLALKRTRMSVTRLTGMRASSCFVVFDDVFAGLRINPFVV